MTSKIRFATTADAPAVLEIYGPFCEDSPISFETERPSVSEIEGRIRKIVERFPWLICENENEVLGYAMRVHTGAEPPTGGRWMWPFTFRENAAPRGSELRFILCYLNSCEFKVTSRPTLVLPFQIPRASGFTSDSALSRWLSTRKSDTKLAPGMMFPGGT